MGEYLINDTTLVSIANAIREKVGTSGGIDPAQMAELIKGIQSGGGAPVVEKEVNFYDYDGTLLYSYTVAEAQALTELPAGQEHEGLVFQKWNWSLENVKALTRAMNIGALYTTDDGTTRLYIHLEEGRTSPMLGVCLNGTVTVDWGDGTTPDVLTGTSVYTVQWTPNHEYAAPGDYVIRLSVDGKASLRGDSSSDCYACVLRYSNTADARNKVYQNALQKIEIGNGVTSIGSNAFHYCYSLSSITIPYGVTSIDNNVFEFCYSLSSITIPDSVMSIDNNVFTYCYSLSSIAIPDGVTSISTAAFQYCYSLSSITIPDRATKINDAAFQYCYSLPSITIPDSVTSIGHNAFIYCHSLTSIAIPDGVTSIGSGTFYHCRGMRFCDFSRHAAVPTLSNTNSFSNTPADFEIRVPAALYDEWIAATNWSTYADKIVAV